MSFENPTNIIRSWALQSSFANGPVTIDKLTPPQYGRIRTNHVTVWRQEALSNNLDWGSQQFSIYLPESLRVVKEMYLQVNLPAISGGPTYKAYPALNIIKEFRIMSNGQEVYNCRYADYLADFCQSLREEELRAFADTFLGGQSATAGARTVLVPLLLPNCPYMQRNGKDHRGHGIMPCFFGQSRLELQITLNTAEYVAATRGTPPASIAGECTLLYHEVQMTTSNILKYADHRGSYSIVTRQFTQLTPSWQVGAQNTLIRWDASQPQGVVTEVMLLAVATDANDDVLSERVFVKPTIFRVIADSVTQRDLNTQFKVDSELYDNGFAPPADFPNCGRICFASHCADGSTHRYSGGYHMRLASKIVFEFQFAVAVKYRIVAVQLMRVKIDSLGTMRSSLE